LRTRYAVVRACRTGALVLAVAVVSTGGLYEVTGSGRVAAPAGLVFAAVTAAVVQWRTVANAVRAQDAFLLGSRWGASALPHVLATAVGEDRPATTAGVRPRLHVVRDPLEGTTGRLAPVASLSAGRVGGRPQRPGRAVGVARVPLPRRLQVRRRSVSLHAVTAALVVVPAVVGVLLAAVALLLHVLGEGGG